jgi:hypothetical protein
MNGLAIGCALGLFTSAAFGASPLAAGETRSAKRNASVLRRGEKIPGAPNVQLADLLQSSESENGKKVIVEGTVRRACEHRGCWMELASDEKGPGVRVTFKNYGFFVPTDSAGCKAKVAGTVKVVDLSEGAAAHYESEGGTVRRDSSGKVREVQLVATGVELRR